jgi:hypothetical protein
MADTMIRTVGLSMDVKQLAGHGDLTLGHPIDGRPEGQPFGSVNRGNNGAALS